MASVQVYQHKKFDLKTEKYNHKKFGKRLNKRKHEEMEGNENIIPITAHTILEQAAKKAQQQPLAKRKQMKSLFRPWLDDDKKQNELSKVIQNTNVLTYNSNMAQQQPKNLLIPQQHQNNKVATPHNKQAQQLVLQQQYFFYQQYQVALMQGNMATALYMRQLQQLAVHKQQQLAVLGQQ